MKRAGPVSSAILAHLGGLAGCSHEPSAAGAPASPAPRSAPSGARIELVVYAATSTRDALLALAPDYEQAHAVDLTFNLGSSGDLSRQIVAAAKADVFLSADEQEMDEVEAAQLVACGSRRVLLSNALAVIEPADGASIFTAPFEPGQLARPEVRRLSLGDVASVPAGRYARAWLVERGVWDDVADRVLPGVDVRAALAAVESGAAQAGIVYRTDAARSKKVRLVHVAPAGEGPRIACPVAAIAGRPHEREARAFVEHLCGAGARATFEELGFLHVPARQAASK